MRRQPRRPSVALLAPVLGACLVSGCGALPVPGGDEPEYDGPTAPNLRLERAWGSESHPVKYASYAVLLGQTVVMSEIRPGSGARPGRTDQQVVAADASTGRVHWTVDKNTPRSPVVAKTGLTKARPDLGYWRSGDALGGDAKATAEPDGGVVAVPYSQSHLDAPAPGYTDGWAIVGIGLADGRPRWAYPAIPQLPKHDPQARKDFAAKVVAVTGSAVVVTVEPPGGGFSDAKTGKPTTTIALDPRTGRKLWSVDKVLATAAVGDSVVALSRAGRSSTTGDAGGIPTVLDARTGKPRWTGKSAAYVESTCAGHAVFRQKDDTTHLEAVDLRDARATELDLDPDGNVVCENGLLGWLGGSTAVRLFTRPVAEDKVERGAEKVGPADDPENATELRTAVGGYLWGTQWREKVGPDLWVTFALDRTGAKRARADGLPLAVSDGFLVVTTSNDDELGQGRPYEVYKLTKT